MKKTEVLVRRWLESRSKMVKMSYGDISELDKLKTSFKDTQFLVSNDNLLWKVRKIKDDP